MTRNHSCKRLLWFAPGGPDEAAFWQQEQWICERWQIFRMHIKQLASDDLCRSPTYSLLCSLSISVSAAQGQAALQDANATTMLPSLAKSGDGGGRRSLRAAVTPVSSGGAAGPFPSSVLLVRPLSTHTQLFGLTSWSSSENNFTRAFKKKEKTLAIIRIMWPGCSSSHWSQN